MTHAAAHRRPRDPSVEYCERTGKRGWASARAARKGMRRLAARLRVYLCKHCRFWHMTSRTEER